MIAIFAVCGVCLSAHAQEKREIELTAQEILARVDRILEYPRGQLKGKMLHIMPDGTSGLITFTGSIADNDFLLKFSNRDRGEHLRVLYNLGGEDVWVYNVHAIKLFHKIDIDKYDSVCGTNFYYIDMSNADYQNNYNAMITGGAVVKGIECHRLKLEPIYRGGAYGQLTLYASKSDSVPVRIDYHDTDRVVFKSLSVVKTMTKNNRIIPIRYDMLDIRKGTVTILELYGFDDTVTFDAKVFYHQRLGEKE